MADKILHKRTATPGKVPAAGDLTPGELALNTGDGKVYTKRDDGGVVEVGGSGGPLFSVMWWPQRSAIPAGYIAADGQALSRTTYPQAWAGIQAGTVPTVAAATWNSTPAERGKFTTGDGSTTFRLPDYNGKFAGSLGAVFLRGDGTLSAAVAGVIQQDAFQGHEHTSGNASTTSGNFVGSSNQAPGTFSPPFGTTTGIASNGTHGTPRTASETRPLNVTGCWVIKLFGAVVNVGSADAAQLASDYANLSGRVSTLEGLGLTKPYVSAEQTITTGGTLNLAHTLGMQPKLVQLSFICKTAEQGFSVGEEVDAQFESNGSNYNYRAAATTTRLRCTCGSNGIAVANASGAFSALTNANWRLIVRAWA